MPTDSERHLGEIEKVLLHLADAKRRISKARESLAKQGAAPHLVSALAVSEQALDSERRRLMQATYYASQDEQETLAV